MYLCFVFAGKEPSEIEARVRKSIEAVVKCDVHEPSAGLSAPAKPPFDAVASFAAILVNSETEEQASKALANALSVLKTAGTFIYLDIIEPSKGVSGGGE